MIAHTRINNDPNAKDGYKDIYAVSTINFFDNFEDELKFKDFQMMVNKDLSLQSPLANQSSENQPITIETHLV